MNRSFNTPEILRLEDATRRELLTMVRARCGGDEHDGTNVLVMQACAELAIAWFTVNPGPHAKFLELVATILNGAYEWGAYEN